jgi:hypothetical protein
MPRCLLRAAGVNPWNVWRVMDAAPELLRITLSALTVPGTSRLERLRLERRTAGQRTSPGNVKVLELAKGCALVSLVAMSRET